MGFFSYTTVTCAKDSISQVRRDDELPAFIHTHAQHSPVQAGDHRATQSDLAHEWFTFIMTEHTVAWI